MNPEHLTAWALNELTPEQRAELEAKLAASPEAKAQADALKDFCALLSQELGEDPGAALLDEQREKLLATEPTDATPDNVLSFAPDSTSLNGHASPLTEKTPTASEATLQPRKSSRMGILLRIGSLAACIAFVFYIVQQQSGPTKASSTTPIVASADDVKVTFGKSVSPAKDSLASPSSSALQPAAPPPAIPAASAAAPVPALKDLEKQFGDTQREVAELRKAKKAMDTPAPAEPMPMLGTVTPVAAPSPMLDAVSGAGAVTKSGNGTLTVGGVNSYSGNTTVNRGVAPKPEMLSREARRRDQAPATSPANPPAPVTLQVNAGTLVAGVDWTGTVGGNGDYRKTDLQGGSDPIKPPGTERYASIQENPFLEPKREPLSTFGLDVDTASYANVRRFLNERQLPPPDAVRLEELINYFPYDYTPPAKDAAEPFRVQVDLAEAPWAPEHRLARIAIKGRELGSERPDANFVFLVDVSGSMSPDDRLPLVKRSLAMLTNQLTERDHVAIVTYAGSSGVALESTSGKDKARIQQAIEALQSGGSTNGASGIQLAYEQAQKHFIKEGTNRVILCTDGDFNVGASSPEALETIIKDKAKSGVFLSVLGVGRGNLQDRTMQTLADKGNGNHAYIDSLAEARKVLVEQMQGTLVTIAKDVKLQVEFNPAQVRAYRLLGYEKRALAKEDFNNDKKDAGELGAGHTVTALYEIVPIDAPLPVDRPLVDNLRYQQPQEKKDVPAATAVPPQQKLEGINDEVLIVKLRYKAPDGDLSKLIETPVKDSKAKFKDTPADFQFATAVAGFGLLLRQSEHAGTLTWEQVRQIAAKSKGQDPNGYRGEFIQLIDKASGLSGQP